MNPDHFRLLFKSHEEFNAWRQSNQFKELDLEDAPLQERNLAGFMLQNCRLRGANLNDAILTKANLDDADLSGAKLEEADLKEASLERANCSNADLSFAKMQGANFSYAILTGTELYNVDHDNKTQFRFVAVDGVSIFRLMSPTKESLPDFYGVSIDAPRMSPELRALVKQDLRRRLWQDWVRNGKNWRRRCLRKIGALWWIISDYGTSTTRIVQWFMIVTAFFTYLYYCLNQIQPDSFHGISNIDKEHLSQPMQLHRCLYFSIVVMTTLGFGDVLPSNNWLSHVAVEAQLLLGYFLLAALVTRMGILFSSVE